MHPMLPSKKGREPVKTCGGFSKSHPARRNQQKKKTKSIAQFQIRAFKNSPTRDYSCYLAGHRNHSPPSRPHCAVAIRTDSAPSASAVAYGWRSAPASEQRLPCNPSKDQGRNRASSSCHASLWDARHRVPDFWVSEGAVCVRRVLDGWRRGGTAR